MPAGSGTSTLVTFRPLHSAAQLDETVRRLECQTRLPARSSDRGRSRAERFDAHRVASGHDRVFRRFADDVAVRSVGVATPAR